MDQSTIDAALKVRGVRGAALVSASGKIEIAQLEPASLTDLIGAMVQVANAIKETGVFGGVARVTLRAENDDDLSLYIKNGQALAVLADRLRPATMLGEDIRKAMG